jgi:hypothetical protein
MQPSDFRLGSEAAVSANPQHVRLCIISGTALGQGRMSDSCQTGSRLAGKSLSERFQTHEGAADVALTLLGNARGPFESAGCGGPVPKTSNAKTQAGRGPRTAVGLVNSLVGKRSRS